MFDIGFFYILLLILFVLLLLIIILYTGGHSRIIAPPLLNTKYGMSTATATINNTWQDLQLIDGSALGTSGSFDFSGTTTPFEFIPLSADRGRNLNGKMLMYAQSQGTSVWFQLRLKDKADDKIIADATNFVLYPEDEFGLQTLQLKFDANNLDDNLEHKFILQAKSRDTTPTFNGTSILVNSAYFTYI